MGENKVEVTLISVEYRLPTRDESQHGLFAFHADKEGRLTGRIAFYSPERGWGMIGEPNEKGEYHFDDITNETDYWAVIPDEFWEGEEEEETR